MASSSSAWASSRRSTTSRSSSGLRPPARPPAAPGARRRAGLRPAASAAGGRADPGRGGEVVLEGRELVGERFSLRRGDQLPSSAARRSSSALDTSSTRWARRRPAASRAPRCAPGSRASALGGRFLVVLRLAALALGAPLGGLASAFTSALTRASSGARLRPRRPTSGSSPSGPGRAARPAPSRGPPPPGGACGRRGWRPRPRLAARSAASASGPLRLLLVSGAAARRSGRAGR